MYVLLFDQNLKAVLMKTSGAPSGSRMVIFSMKTTKYAITHLKIKHIGPDGLIVSGTTAAQQTIQAAFGRSMPRIILNEDIFKELLLLWIVDANVTFRTREQRSFRTLCAYLAACQPDYSGIYRALPQSGNAIKRYLLTWYEAMRKEVKSKLHSATVKIHFSFDMWSGPNQHSYQAIVARWLDGVGILHAALLSLHRFEGAHSGINQAEHLWQTLQLYDILPFVVMFNVDNASITIPHYSKLPAVWMKLAIHPSILLWPGFAVLAMCLTS